MLTDGLRLTEGSSIINAAVAAGTSFPSSPDDGELFFRSDLDALHVYNGTQWIQVGLTSALLDGQPGSYYLAAANQVGTTQVAQGGTGATDATAARTNLGLVIGTNVQAFDQDLLAIAALAGTAGFLKKTAANTWSLDTASYLPSTGGTIVGNLTMTGSIIPSANITYDLGSPTMMWKDIYVGPGSIYMNGQKILENVSDTIIFSADDNQNVRIETGGTGTLELQTAVTGTVAVKSTMTITSGKRILDSAGVQVEFGDNIEMNANRITGLASPLNANDATTKTYVDSLTGNDGSIVRTSGDQTIAGNKTFSGNVVVSGSFSATGGIAMFADNILEFNSDFTTGTPTESAGFQIRRGDLGVVRFQWDETNDRFTMQDGSNNFLDLFTTGTITATNFVGNASTATALATGRTIAMTGDVAWTSASFTGAGNVTGTSTLATVNSNVGSFGSSTQIPVLTINAKGLVTAASVASITTSFGITGDVSGTIDGGTDVLTLATVNSNVGSFGSSTQIPTFTVNAKGLVTAAGTTPVSSIAIAESQITDGTLYTRNAGTEIITGSWTFGPSPSIISTSPGVVFIETDAPANQRSWLLVADSANFQLQTRADTTFDYIGTPFQVNRDGFAVFTGTVTAAEPTAPTHLTTKQYVDNIAAGMVPHAAVRAATTVNITLSGAQTIDGVALVAGNRVLVKNQTTASQNGVYVVATGAWTRATDFDGNPSVEVAAGDVMFVDEGTVNADTSWVLITGGPITIGTTALEFTIFARAGSITSGTGITVSGNQVNLNNVGTAGTYRSVTTNAQGQVTAGTNPTTLAGYGITDALLKTGDIFTGQLVSNFGGNAPSANAHIVLSNGSNYSLSFVPRTGAGSYNQLAQAGDAQIVYSAGAMDNGSLVIGPWTASGKGLRIAADGNTTFSHNIVAAGVRASHGLPVGDVNGFGYGFGANGDTGMFAAGAGAASDQLNFYVNAFESARLLSTGLTVFGADLRVGGSNRLLIQHDGSNAYIRPLDGGTLNLGSGAVNTLFLTTLGATVQGTLNVQGVTTVNSTLNVGVSPNGTVVLQGGDTGRTGFINFFAANGNRQGYIGFASTNTSLDTGTLNYVAGNHQVTGTMSVSGAITGNLSGNANSATVLQTPRTIALSGAATGTATTFNGSANITIPVTGLNASNLDVGTVPNARISGAYTGFTNVTSGNLTSTNSGVGLRMKNSTGAGGIATLVYADAADFYMLMTDNNDADGSYNGLRPLRINKTSGAVFIEHGLSVNGAINGNLSGNATTASTATLATKASTLSQSGGNGAAMTFHWAGQGGQPSWLWGGNDGVNHYVYSPSNLSVAFATNATNATNATSATTATNATNLGGASADDHFRYRAAVVVADVNNDRLGGSYILQDSGFSEMLLEFKGGSSSPRLQIIANYSDDLWFRVARDTMTQWDGVGYKDKRILHSANFNSFAPGLTGAGASGTWGINISGSAAAVGGYGVSVSNAANTLIARDGNGYTYTGYINTNVTNNENGTVSQVMITNGDNFMRKASVAHLTASLSGTAPINITGNAGNTSSISNAVGNGHLWTGVNQFRTNNGNNTYTVNHTNYGLQAFSNDGGAASMSFHRGGSYAINLGLDPDNSFRVGGWSDGAVARFSANADGQFFVRSHVHPGGNIYTDDNYGFGLVGVYSDVRYQGVFAMGDAYKLPADGTSPGSLYGIAWTHTNIGGQSKAGLGHQALFMTNGVTTAAVGNGIWTSGVITTTSNIIVSGSISSSNSISSSSSINASGELYTASHLRIQSNAPTIYLQDTDGMPAFIHNNSNLLYVLRSASANAATWDSGPNGRHPMVMNLSNGNVEFSGDITAFSDSRLKKNIVQIDNALEKVEALRGVTFDHLEQGRGTGLIAQELQTVLPEAVHESEDNGYLTVAYGNTVGLLVEAIKELSAQNKTLMARLAALEAKE